MGEFLVSYLCYIKFNKENQTGPIHTAYDENIEKKWGLMADGGQQKQNMRTKLKTIHFEYKRNSYFIGN